MGAAVLAGLFRLELFVADMFWNFNHAAHITRRVTGRRKAMKTNNAPSDWTPAGAAYESASDSTTLREDLRFAAEALGFRELLASLEDPREEALALLGGAMMALGFLLLALGA